MAFKSSAKTPALIPSKAYCTALISLNCSSKDEIAKIMYFFNVTFDVKDKKEVTLPIDNDIVIISAATLNSETAEIKTQLLEEVEPRKFNFKMTRQEKHNYRVERRYKNMGDKKFYERKGWGKDY